jgi:urease accessory protein
MLIERNSSFPVAETTAEEVSSAHLLRLLTWFSPAFPVGAFGYSHGLETAIREGRAATAPALQAWIEALLTHGSGWTDAVIFRLAWAADRPGLAELAELAEALTPSLERRLETMRLGAAFSAAVQPWTDGRTCEGPYPVVAGAACAAAGLPLDLALVAWLHAFVANLVSVGVRAIPIGQREAVAIIAALEPVILQVAGRAAAAGPQDLGGCAFLSDIAAMRHETLQPRLFIS